MNHEDEVYSVAFSPDGKYLATTSSDKTARVWEATTGEQIARMNHEDQVRSVAFSPDGKYLATASSDKTARVWEATCGKEIARMSHEDAVRAAFFSPDGKYLATASSDKTARVWLLWPKDLIAEASSRLTRNLTYQEWQRFLSDEPYRKTCPNLPIHPSFIEAGRELARAGDVKGAVTIFRRAKKLEPTLDLDPEAEARKFAAEAPLTEE
jgi:WD40 repeat protein